MARKCMTSKSAKVTFWISAIILVISVSLLLVFPTIYKNQLKKEITLTEGSMVTDIWKDIPLPLYERLYFFNITNAEEFTLHGAPLNVSEVGPYVYKGHWVKDYLHQNPNGTVSYRETRTYTFVSNMSAGSEDDVIFSLNGPMVIASEMSRKFPNWTRILASIGFGIEAENVVTSKSVRELVYDGYKDIIIRLAPIIDPDIPFKEGRFAWLYGKNATNDGLFTVFTGADDNSNTGILNNWNGQEKLPFWKGDACNMLNGTSIEVGPPLPDSPESYSFFQSILCRSLTFNYTGDYSMFDIDIKRFEPTSMIFANGSENPENACFEMRGSRPSGVLDVSPCQFNAPVYVSFPHFYMADRSFLETTNNLEPNAEKHGSYMGVEPITGVSVDIKIRFQINLELSRVPGILQLSNITEGIYPVFWASIELQMDDSWAHFFKSKLNNPQIIAYSVLGILVLLSTILIISSVVVMCLTKYEDDDDPLIDIKEEEKANINKRRIQPGEGSVNYGATDSFLSE